MKTRRLFNYLMGLMLLGFSHSMNAQSIIDSPLIIKGNTSITDSLGVGTDAPRAKLDVVGNAIIEGSAAINGIRTGSLSPLTANTGASGMNTITVFGGGSQNKFMNFRAGGNPFGNSGIMFSSFSTDHFMMYRTGNGLAFKYSNQNTDQPDLRQSTEIMTLAKNGNLGIGQINPQSKLEVSGDVKATAFIGDGSQLTGINASDNWEQAGDALFNKNSGNVGIGVNAPVAKLHVNGNTRVEGVLNVESSIRTTDNIRIDNEDVARFQAAGNLELVANDNGQGNGDAIILKVGDAGADKEKMRVTVDGNVGIGTASPTEKLHVDGNVRVGKHLLINGTRSGIAIEEAGILNFGYNFRFDDVNLNEEGGTFRIDPRLQNPLFQWIRRPPGTVSGTALMSLTEEGNLSVNGRVNISNVPAGTGDILLIDANGNLVRSNIVVNRKIEDLEVENMELKERLEKLETLVHSLTKTSASPSQTLPTSALLDQNVPNPFNQSTTINYDLSEEVQIARLMIMDLNGNVLQNILIEERGQGQIELQANTLAAGTYTYGLIVDGRILATKKMILVR